MRRLRALSLRARLALLFAAGSTAILVLAGTVLYANLTSEISATINSGLSSRADDIAGDRAAAPTTPPSIRREEPFAQVIGPDNSVLTASATLAGLPDQLSDHEFVRAQRQQVTVDRTVRGFGRDTRLLARPVNFGGSTLVVIVGSRLDALRHARRRLALLLGVTSPALIAALAFGGFAVATFALRPVRYMTEEADRISLDDPGRRLPVPGTEDEIARLAHTLNAMLERIEASFRRERAFVDDASHELRTPVAILRGELELALAEPDDHEAVVAAMQSALEEAQRLSRVAEDLLVLARVDTEGLALQAAPVDLLDVAHRARDRVLRHTPTPVAAVRGNHVEVLGDELWLEQLIANLVSNAVRAADTVEVRVERVDDHAVIVVADDGPGFPPALLPVAFDRFARSPAREGAGLGLAIVAALAQAHGGTVDASNGPPLGGAAVRVTLPAA